MSGAKSNPPLTDKEKARQSWVLHVEGQATQHRRDYLFTELTGLRRYDFSTWNRRGDLIEAQAFKIAGLKNQMRQMQRGYEKKIKKLEAALARARGETL